MNNQQILINHDNLKFINRSRATRIYVNNKPDLNDPIIDNLNVIAIPHEDNHNFKVGDTLTACSLYSNTIFQNITFFIFDSINLYLLNEYRHIDTSKFSYFAVIHNK
jgi:hypothetical protein